MRNKILGAFFASFILMLSLASCVKDPVQKSAGELCYDLHQLHAHPVAAVRKGDEITVSADYMDGATYYWTGPNNFQSYSADNTIATYADYTDRGWYYVNMSLGDACVNNFDSVYVDVKFPQGTAACSPANNTASFTGAFLLGDQSYYYVSFGAAPGGYGITGNSSNGDINITMSGYWITEDLEDGIYYTTSSPLPEYSEIDKVHISNVNQSIYWSAEPDKPVYISHVGGKRRITFCDIDFTGDWGGTLYHTTVAAQLTEP